jgi:hypothetical protein
MFKPGDKVKVSALGNHGLVLGALGRVIGYAGNKETYSLLIGGIAIASAPGTCLHKYLGTLPDYSNDED